MIFNLVEKFRNRDTSDERTCLIHDDIRYQNIVYDPQIKQFVNLLTLIRLMKQKKCTWGSHQKQWQLTAYLTKSFRK